MKRLTDKVALITGGSAGIGRASALLFAAEGAAIGVVDINEDGGQATVAEIRDAGGRATFVRADVAMTDQLEGAFAALVEAFGGLDILYNNAGGATARDGDVSEMPLDEFEHAIGLNLFGTFAACHFAIPLMAARGGGSIINTASIRAMTGTRGADAYTAAKGGVVTLTRALAIQCAPKGIRVNAIAPGGVLTERVRALMAQGSDSGPDEALVRRHLFGLGEPEDVASVALFFAGEDSRWVTGQILPVDGGASAN